jgi:hypothetical protein
MMLISGLIGVLFAGPVLAHGGYRHYHGGPRTSVGIVVGAPLYWGWGYYPPYYAPYYYPPYYAPAVVSRQEPTTYIERGDAAAAAGPTRDYWYYCPEAQAYYPYVKQCAKGWQRVNPQPPD